MNTEFIANQLIKPKLTSGLEEMLKLEKYTNELKEVDPTDRIAMEELTNKATGSIKNLLDNFAKRWRTVKRSFESELFKLDEYIEKSNKYWEEKVSDKFDNIDNKAFTEIVVENSIFNKKDSILIDTITDTFLSTIKNADKDILSPVKSVESPGIKNLVSGLKSVGISVTKSNSKKSNFDIGTKAFFNRKVKGYTIKELGYTKADITKMVKTLTELKKKRIIIQIQEQMKSIHKVFDNLDKELREIYRVGDVKKKTDTLDQLIYKINRIYFYMYMIELFTHRIIWETYSTFTTLASTIEKVEIEDTEEMSVEKYDNPDNLSDDYIKKTFNKLKKIIEDRFACDLSELKLTIKEGNYNEEGNIIKSHSDSSRGGYWTKQGIIISKPKHLLKVMDYYNISCNYELFVELQIAHIIGKEVWRSLATSEKRYYDNLLKDYSTKYLELFIDPEPEKRFCEYVAYETANIDPNDMRLVEGSELLVKSINISDIPNATLTNFFNTIQPCDLLVTKAKNYDSMFSKFRAKILAYVQGGKFVSIRMVESPTTIIGYGVHVGLKHGQNVLMSRKLKAWIKHIDTVIVLRVPNLTDEQKHTIISFLKKHRSLSYNKVGVTTSFINRFLERVFGRHTDIDTKDVADALNPMFCSNILAKAFRIAGVELKFNISDNLIWPKDFVLNDQIEKICKLIK